MKKFYLFCSALLFASQVSGQACTTPTIGVDPQSICSGTSATLSATTDGTDVKWFDSPTATTAIATGLTFTTPVLTSAKTYWAEAYSYGTGTAVNGGKITPGGTGSSSVVAATSPWGLAFNTTSDFTIETVDVYAAGSGNMIIKLLDENYATLLEKPVVIPTGGTTSAPLKVTLSLGFQVTAGKSYKLVSSQSPVLIRDLSGNSFPYAIGTVGSVTGGTINNSTSNNSVYYFFYNWKVTPTTVCASGKKEVLVDVKPTPAAPVANSPQILPNGSTLADIQITGSNIMWYADEALTSPLPMTTLLIDNTTYYATQTVNGCASLGTAVTVMVGLAVTEANKSGFAIYPNPATDFVNIVGKEKITGVDVYDNSGKLVLSKSFNISDSQINIKMLPTGNYRLLIKTAKGSFSSSIIKK